MCKQPVVGLLLLSCLLLSCCTGRQDGKDAGPRDFPMARVPAALTDADARVAWISEHYWDAFLDPSAALPSRDSVFNGVPSSGLEQQMGNYSFILQMVPVAEARKALGLLYDRLDDFEAQAKDDTLRTEITRLLEKYLYDPNSPLRCEDAFHAVAARLSEDGRLGDAERDRYAHIARMSALNTAGTPAADFSFVDTKGRQHTLYGIRAERLLLVFGNPDCTACGQLTEALSADPVLAGQIRSGALKVVDIYIDEDIAGWKARADSYPADWINGCDPDGAIRSDRLYNVRAIPSLYLLDADKTVLLKDVPQERLLDYLANQLNPTI